jgi:hypothetical protein
MSVVVVVVNAFSVNMMSSLFDGRSVHFTELTLEQARLMANGAVSAVGHADTAKIFTSLLGTEVRCSRETLSFGVEGATLLLGQYSGLRLPEGASSLPPGASIKWIRVGIYSQCEQERLNELYYHS